MSSPPITLEDLSAVTSRAVPLAAGLTVVVHALTLGDIADLIASHPGLKPVLLDLDVLAVKSAGGAEAVNALVARLLHGTVEEAARLPAWAALRLIDHGLALSVAPAPAAAPGEPDAGTTGAAASIPDAPGPTSSSG